MNRREEFRKLFVSFAKSVYTSGYYTDADIAKFVSWGTITAANYQTITGKEYDVKAGDNDVSEAKK